MPGWREGGDAPETNHANSAGQIRERSLASILKTLACVRPAAFEKAAASLFQETVVPRPKTRVRGSACRRGHALTGDNVYAATDGHVQCKRCRADQREVKRLQNLAIRAAIAAGASDEALEALISAERFR
jgi:hypothetical protein